MYSKKKIRFDIINPTSPLWRVEGNKRPVKSKTFRFSMLPSLYVAASMPSYVDTRVIDEDVEAVDFETDADIIGVSFMTYNAPRAYEIGDQFKKKGKTVIFGGYHPTFMMEEAIRHADSICLGEAELNIPRMMEDYRAGRLQSYYKSDLVDLDNLPELDRSLINKKAYFITNVLQATRGCRHRCTFCSVAPFHQYKIRNRPIGKVLKELNTMGRYILFMDDNLTLNREYAKELFAQMIPLKKRWFSQCGVGITDDDELLHLAAKSGCSGLFIGFESLSERSLNAWKKHCNRRRDYLEVVRRLHKKGIAICAAFVFGCDEDDRDVFATTLDFLLEANVETIQSTRLTPFPGTPLFEQMNKEDRITDQDWSHYDFFHVVYKPLHMDAETLHQGTAWLQKEFYSYKNIVRRVGKAMKYLNADTILRAVLPVNLGYRFKLSSYGAFETGNSFQP